MKHRILSALSVGVLLLAAVPAALAANILVDSLADNEFTDGQVTLREAIRAAVDDVSVDGSNAGGASDRIAFAPGLSGGTVVLNGGMFQIENADSLTIDAVVGGTDITIDAGGASRIFYLSTTALELRGLTLTGGFIDGAGGAIWAAGSGAVVLDGVTVRGNQATGNGGGLSLSGPVTLIDTVIRDNAAGDNGGGLHYGGWVDRDFSAVDTRIVANNAGGDGGGLWIGEGSQVTMTDCAVDSNVVEPTGTQSSLGGGLYTEGDVTLVGTSVSWNQALAGSSSSGTGFTGGAINIGGHLVLDGGDVTGNSAEGLTLGGGLANTYHGTRDGLLELLGSTVSGNSAGGSGGIHNYEELILRDSFILDNTADEGAGGVDNLGTLTAERTVFRGNQGDSGAMSSSTSGVTDVIDCEFDANTATDGGGAIRSLGQTTVTGTEFHANTAQTGGAIHANIGVLEVRDCVIHHNSAEFGGGVYTKLNGGDSALIIDTTLHDNTAAEDGGGLFLLGDAEVVQSTLTANLALGYGGGLHHGDEFPVNDGLLELRQCTVVGNTGNLGGGGVTLIDTAELGGNIISGNIAFADVADVERSRPDMGTSGIVSSQGYNLIGDHDLISVHPQDQAGVLDPMLGVLQDNGGPTPTLLPFPGSPALDASSVALTFDLPYDQRGAGHPRVVDAGVNGAIPDCGAVEFNFECETLVTRTDDVFEPGSLRFVLDCAAPGDTVTFDPVLAGQTILLDGTQIDLTKDVRLDAGGLGVTIDAGGISRIFEIPSGVNVDLVGLTLTGGAAEDGGGIMVFGDLDMYSCVLTGNEAYDTGAGAAVYGGGSILAYDTEVSFNVCDGSGGGLYANGAASSLILTLARVHDNSADALGGGAFADNGSSVSVNMCEFQGNTAGSGGAIKSFATATILASTFVGNAATGYGGAVDATDTLHLKQCTFTDNTATVGGALAAFSDFAYVEQNTFHGNTATGNAGAVYNNIGNMRFGNNILTGNTAPDGDVVRGPSGNNVSDGHNLVGVAVPNVFGQPGDLTGAADPRLAPLGDFGGPTRTMPLLYGCPALDAGDPDTCGQFVEDQRGAGFPRGVDGDGDGDAACDIGALESAPLEFGVPITATETLAGFTFAGFDGLGFAPFPAPGQLDSDQITIFGVSDETTPMHFGHTADVGDYARGFGLPDSAGAFGAFDGSSGASLALLPADDDFTPGGVIAAFRNLTGGEVTSMLVELELGLLNQGDHALSVQMAWAAAPTPEWDTSQLSFTEIPEIAYITPGAASASPSWQIATPDATVTGLALPQGGVFYLRLLLDDAGGADAYDAVSLDNLAVTANPPVASGVDDTPLLADDATHALGGVHPNPFNPRASFTLTVDRDQHVRVELVDVAGRRVGVLHEGPLAGGAEHRFDLDGRGLPSAVYFVRVHGGRFADVRRAVLVK